MNQGKISTEGMEQLESPIARNRNPGFDNNRHTTPGSPDG
jgi:hypothetical protein